MNGRSSERARAGGAGTPVRFTVSITRRLTSAGQEHYNTILLWTVSLPGAPNLPWLPWLSLQCIASKIQQGQKKTKKPPKIGTSPLSKRKASGATGDCSLLPIISTIGPAPAVTRRHHEWLTSRVQGFDDLVTRGV